MTVKSTMKAFCVGKNEKKSQDGKTTYYSVAIEQDGEAGSISCTEEVYQAVEKFKPFNFIITYNDKYSSLKAIGLVPTNAK